VVFLSLSRGAQNLNSLGNWEGNWRKSQGKQIFVTQVGWTKKAKYDLLTDEKKGDRPWGGRGMHVSFGELLFKNYALAQRGSGSDCRRPKHTKSLGGDLVEGL